MNIVVLQGHPDPAGGHFCEALADAYADGARAAGHELRTIEVAKLDFPLLRSKSDYEGGTVPPALADVQEAIAWADHLLIVYPLWLGEMPALLKGLLEQVLRPGFAYRTGPGQRAVRPLKGKSARVVVTMGMPALAYRWYFGAHGLKNLRRNVLAFVGIGPVRASLIGIVEGIDARRRARWLGAMRRLGAQAQ
jgi:putative NADPH-quinone reductase